MGKTGVRNKEWDWKDTGQKISMGEQVGKILHSLKDTACIHFEEREAIAIMRMYMKMFPEDKEFNDFLEKFAIPAFKELGYGRWYRDVITDLALALSGKTKKSKKVSAKGVLKNAAST